MSREMYRKAPGGSSQPRLTQPVVAYRSWLMRRYVKGEEEIGLFSITINHHAWLPGPNKAVCEPPAWQEEFGFPHHLEAPHPDCACGLHGNRSLRDVSTNCYGVGILGAVLLWGRMLAGPTTIRAEFGEVLALSRIDTDTKLKDHPAHLSRTSGVPLVPLENLRDYALEHGAELPDEPF